MAIKNKTDWQTKKLGDYYDITSSKRVYKSEWKNTGVPFYRAREIVKLSQLGFVHNDLFISEEMYNRYANAYGVPKIGDIMVTGVGTLGICYVINNDFRFYFKDGNIIWLRKKDNIDSQFVEYAFKSELIRKQIDNSVGATVGTLTIIKAKNIQISLPSLSEQRRIVKILDGVFEKIEQVKEVSKRNLQNSQELFESYLQSVFINGNKNMASKKLSSLCEIQYGYTKKANTNGSFRFIRISDIDENGFLTQDKKMYIDYFSGISKYVLNNGDLLMARTGASAGNLLYYEGNEKSVFASYLIRIVFRKEIISKLYWFFSKSHLYWDQVRHLSAGSAQPQFNGNALKQIIFTYPKSLNEQTSIVANLDALSENTKKLQFIYKQKLDNLEELKKSILRSAFNGEL